MHDKIQIKTFMAQCTMQTSARIQDNGANNSTKEVLDSLEADQKIQIIINDYLKIEAAYWKEQFDQEKQ